MKLLLDQNVSFRLVKKLESKFPGTQHVSDVGLNNWARKEDFVIVTFDSDFYDFSLTVGHPPKLIWVRSGNCTTSNLERLLIEKADQIEAFSIDPELGCLEIVD